MLPYFTLEEKFLCATSHDPVNTVAGRYAWGKRYDRFLEMGYNKMQDICRRYFKSFMF